MLRRDRLLAATAACLCVSVACADEPTTAQSPFSGGNMAQTAPAPAAAVPGPPVESGPSLTRPALPGGPSPVMPTSRLAAARSEPAAAQQQLPPATPPGVGLAPLAAPAAVPVSVPSFPAPASPAAPIANQSTEPNGGQAVASARQPAPVPASPPVPAPVTTTAPPADVEGFLARLSGSERQQLLDYQVETFEDQLRVERAAVRRNLCQNYGGLECAGGGAVGMGQMGPPAAAAMAVSPAAGAGASGTKAVEPKNETHELPAVYSITGGHGTPYSAVLIYRGGQTLPVFAPDGHGRAVSALPTGEEVISVVPGEVKLRTRDGNVIPLLFNAAAAPTPTPLKTAQ